MDRACVGGFQLSALMLWSLATREKDMRVGSRAHKEQKNQEFRRKATWLVLRPNRNFSPETLTYVFFNVSNYHIPLLASHTHPCPNRIESCLSGFQTQLWLGQF